MEPLNSAGVSRSALDADVAVVAPTLLGALLVGHGVTVELTEVEAYAGHRDPASHAYRRTPRSEIMYGPPGLLYVYRIHQHVCANVVTSPDGQASAVLLRAGTVVDGIALARQRRGGDVADTALARGPGNLTRALGITMADLGSDLCDRIPIRLGETSRRPPPTTSRPIRCGPRVGVRRAADVPWRFWFSDDPTVSTYRRHRRAHNSSTDDI